MKPFKFTFAIALAALGLASLSMAQQAGPQGGAPRAGQGQHRFNPGRMMHLQQEAFSRLNLSAAQKAQIKQLQEQTRSRMMALFAQAKQQGQQGNREALRPQFTEIRKGYMDGLKSILSKAQFKQYQAEMKTLREQMRAQRNKNTIKP